jgi:hypothetical protein
VTGADTSQRERSVTSVAIPPDEPNLLDVLVLADWSRFSRERADNLAVVERVRRAGGGLWPAGNPGNER